MEQLSLAFAGIIDSQMVSALGISAISAVSVTVQPKLFLMCAFSARAGSLALSVYSVDMNLMSINFALGTGFQASCVALVGSCYGADDEDGIRDYSSRIVKIGLIVSAVCSLAFVIFGRRYRLKYYIRKEVRHAD